MTNTQFLLDLQLPVNPLTLLAIDSRQKCSKCGKTARWVCLECGIGVNIPEIAVPELPRPVTGLFYEFGNIKKSSLQLLAPLRIPGFSFLTLREDLQFDASCTYLLFPSSDALEIKQIPDLGVAKFVVLDCTWPQARKCMETGCLSGLRRVRISSHATAFWRPHGRGAGSGCLSSAECVYWLCCDLERELCRRGAAAVDAHKYDAIMTLYAAQALLVKRELFLRQRTSVAAGRKGELEYEDWETCEQALQKQYGC